MVSNDTMLFIFRLYVLTIRQIRVHNWGQAVVYILMSIYDILMSKRRLFCSQLGTKYYGVTCYHTIYFMFLVHTT